MFPAVTGIPGASAPGPSNPLLKTIGNQYADARFISAGRAKDINDMATGTVENMCESKAETAIKLMLMGGRKLSGKTLGIIGFGRTGRETARRAHFGFGMKIVVHNRSAVSGEDLDQFNAAQADDIDDLLGQSDFVSLHCPAHPENSHLIDALRLNRMTPDACLINTAGAELVDEEALADALWYNTIAGAGLDTAANETPVCDRLCGCENVILLPLEDSASRNVDEAA